MASSMDRGYLTPSDYLNCNLTQQNDINERYRNFFQQPKFKIQTPLLNNGLRFFTSLALIDSRSGNIGCMGHNKTGVRCSNQVHAVELCNNMQRLWAILNDASLQGDSLLHELYDTAKHFLCIKNQHREQANGRSFFAEELTKEWYPVVLQFRIWLGI